MVLPEAPPTSLSSKKDVSAVDGVPRAPSRCELMGSREDPAVVMGAGSVRRTLSCCGNVVIQVACSSGCHDGCWNECRVDSRCLRVPDIVIGEGCVMVGITLRNSWRCADDAT
jgi:hypothetical protein